MSLTKEEVEEKLKMGVPYVIRQNNPTEGTTTFHDELYGDITVENSELDDMILIKSDGFPTYNFANVVDDHLMGITHVVRGNEYLSSSPKYNRLYEAFDWEVPVYVHCPLITNEEHKKLSKRSGHSSFEDLIEQGFLTEAIVNFVALLGWSSEDNREIFSLEELVEAFDYHHMSKSPAVFDITKLSWMNGEYIKAMDFDRFYSIAEEYIKKTVPKARDEKKIASLVKTRIERFTDIAEQIDFLQELPEYDPEMYVHKKMKTTKETSLAVLEEVLPILEKQEDYTNDALYGTLLEFIKEKGYKIGLASSTKEKSVRRHLENAKILNYFEVIVTGDMVEHSKPHPEIYLLAVEKLKSEKEKTVAVEDSFHGITSAYRAGIKPIMIPDMVQPTEEIKKMLFYLGDDLLKLKEIL